MEYFLSLFQVGRLWCVAKGLGRSVYGMVKGRRKRCEEVRGEEYNK